jgi:excinuclease ABC subunit C
MRDIKAFLANLPHNPGVYQMLGSKGEVIYVGKAKNLKNRLSSYFSGSAKDPKTISLVEHTCEIDITVTSSENEAVLLECNLIKQHHPRYNILLRDDKSYPYIVISRHPYPRIDMYRGVRKKNALYFGPYPSSLAVRETISLLQKLFHLRTCRDSYFETRSRPCLLYQIGRCSGPCVGLIPQEEYTKNVQLAIKFLEGKGNEVIDELQKKMASATKELHFEIAAHYRDQINRLRQIQNRQYVNVKQGDADVIGLAVQAGIICIQLISIRHGQVLGSRSYYPSVPMLSSDEEIVSAFLSQHYFHHVVQSDAIPKQMIIHLPLPDRDLLESALSAQGKHPVRLICPRSGEKRKWLEMAMTSAKQSLAAHLLSKTNIQERLTALQTALHLKKPLLRIECFDISHSMGEATVASCVVFNQEGPLKSDYRRFNITDITPGDDVAAMHQVVLRRFKRLQKDAAPLPQLVLIDGGATQLAAAESALAEIGVKGILLVGVSKGPDRKAGFESLHRTHCAPIHLPADSHALHLIQQIRDEAHRFAITGHRMRRDKTRRQSVLESIPGVGVKRRRDLLRYFGGIQGVAHASLDELMKVNGINRLLAEKIFAALHDTTL